MAGRGEVGVTDGALGKDLFYRPSLTPCTWEQSGCPSPSLWLWGLSGMLARTNECWGGPHGSKYPVTSLSVSPLNPPALESSEKASLSAHLHRPVAKGSGPPSPLSASCGLSVVFNKQIFGDRKHPGVWWEGAEGGACWDFPRDTRKQTHQL